MLAEFSLITGLRYGLSQLYPIQFAVIEVTEIRLFILSFNLGNGFTVRKGFK